MEKRTKFIINFLYFAIIIALAFFVLRFALSFLFPFVAALFIAYILRRPIQFITTKTQLPRKLSAIHPGFFLCKRPDTKASADLSPVCKSGPD